MDQFIANFDNCNFDEFVGLISNLNPKEAQKGIFNEFGTSKAPARPFLEPSYLKNEKWIIQQVIKNAKKLKSPKQTVDEIGDEMVDRIKHKINVMKYPKLAQSTIKRKGRDDLLKDTEKMYQAIRKVRIDK